MVLQAVSAQMEPVESLIFTSLFWYVPHFVFTCYAASCPRNGYTVNLELFHLTMCAKLILILLTCVYGISLVALVFSLLDLSPYSPPWGRHVCVTDLVLAHVHGIIWLGVGRTHISVCRGLMFSLVQTIINQNPKCQCFVTITYNQLFSPNLLLSGSRRLKRRTMKKRNNPGECGARSEAASCEFATGKFWKM